MSTIADSDAFRDDDRILAQHQAALTLLQSRLSAPGIERLAWLDLACGRGQIISSLDQNLSKPARAKIEYLAYDADQGFARETGKTAANLGFHSTEVRIGDLSDFDRILPAGKTFDFITLTNTIHEIQPARLATLLVGCLARLSPTGSLFVYDMERIQPPELGAVPWSRDDVSRIALRMLNILGATNYRPEVGLWRHKTCDGWNLHLERQHLGLSDQNLRERSKDAVAGTLEEISNALRQRLAACRESLEALTTYGAETAEEQQDKQRLLFEFWSLSRALEHKG